LPRSLRPFDCVAAPRRKNWSRVSPLFLLQQQMTNPIALSVILTRTFNKENDDALIVRRQDNNFLVTYNDAETKKYYKLILTNTSLGEYVKNLCYLYSTDCSPFAEIQFNFLGFPTYMATQSTFKNNKRLTSTLISIIADIVSESIFADYPEGVYCDNADDLPGLIPIYKKSDAQTDDELPGLIPLCKMSDTRYTCESHCGESRCYEPRCYEPRYESHY